MIRKFLMIAFLFLVAIASLSAQTYITSCSSGPYIANVAGTYYHVSGTLTAATGQDCIQVTANNVTIIGDAGNSISFDGGSSPYTYGIKGVGVSNLLVTGVKVLGQDKTYGLYCEDCTGFNMNSSTFEAQVYVTSYIADSSTHYFSGNTFKSAFNLIAQIQINPSAIFSHTRFENNTFDMTGSNTGVSLGINGLQDSLPNTSWAANNTFTGWLACPGTGAGCPTVDDGIIVSRTLNFRIWYNTFNPGFYDCAIEGSSTNQYLYMDHNTFTDTGRAFCQYYIPATSAYTPVLQGGNFVYNTINSTQANDGWAFYFIFGTSSAVLQAFDISHNTFNCTGSCTSLTAIEPLRIENNVSGFVSAVHVDYNDFSTWPTAPYFSGVGSNVTGTGNYCDKTKLHPTGIIQCLP